MSEIITNHIIEMQKSVKELKHSMQLHIRVAGGITDAMGYVAAKLLDLFDEYFEAETPATMGKLAAELVKMLTTSVIERVECYEVDVRYIKSMIPEDVTNSEGFGKPQYLRALACALREFAKATNADVIDVYDSNGVIQ